MKIAVAVTEPLPTATVHRWFGRSPCCLVFETDNDEVRIVANPDHDVCGGSGLELARSLIAEGVNVLLANHCSPNAYSMLVDNGVTVVLGCRGAAQTLWQRGTSGKYQSRQSSGRGTQ